MKRSAAVILAAGLVIAACGSDDDEGSGDTTAATEAPAETDAMEEEPAETDAMEEEPAETDAMEEEEPAEGSGAALPTEGSVEVAAGTVLNLDECPDDWNPVQGVDGDEIRLAWSGPQSGALAAFGAIGEGMGYYFDYLNDTDPIDGKQLVLEVKDDGYEAGRTVANVEEMIDTSDPFAFVHLIGTPNNLAARPITDEACVPQLFNSSGFPLWGDPANFPWTVGNILNYVTETEIWCGAIIDEFGEGATAAALIMNNDFGKTYQNTLANSEACAGVDVIEEQLHDPAAADVTNEMTTIIASDAQVFLNGSTSQFCSQATVALASSEWRPRAYYSYTCNNLASFFEPVKDSVATLAADGAAPYMTNSNKVCGDPAYDGDPSVELTIQVLDEYGGVTCADGSFSTGVLYGQMVEDILRSAAELEGGLNRVNLMAALWNADTSNDNLLGGTLKLDGVNDAFWTEGAQIQEVVVDGDRLTWANRGEFQDLEGQGGSYEG